MISNNQRNQQMDRVWRNLEALRERRADIALLSGLCPSGSPYGLYLSKADLYVNLDGVMIKPNQWYPIRLEFSIESPETLCQHISQGTSIDQLADALEQALIDLNDLEQALYQNLCQKFQKYNPEVFSNSVS
jgi:hypothetical protein